MTIYLGADHRGFKLREHLKRSLVDAGYTVVDLGNTVLDASDDYPDFARAVAVKVAELPTENRGIVICGSGVGMDIVSNKTPGIRAAYGMSPVEVQAARKDDDVNVLALAADFTDEAAAFAMTKAFLETPFDGEERHQRRIDKI